MYEFAYNDVIEDSHQTLRAREQAAMDRVIGMLRAAQERGPQSRELIDALFYLRRLWVIFIDDLNDPNNELVNRWHDTPLPPLFAMHVLRFINRRSLRMKSAEKESPAVGLGSDSVVGARV